MLTQFFKNNANHTKSTKNDILIIGLINNWYIP